VTTVNVLPSQRPEKGSRSAGRLVEVKVYGVFDDDRDLVAVPGQPQPVQARVQICTERDGELPAPLLSASPRATSSPVERPYSR